MGRIIIIFFIIMFVNFIKKVLEAAKKNQGQGAVRPPDFAENEAGLDELLAKDDFLNAFKSDQNIEEAPPALQQGSRLVTAMSDLMERKKKTFSKKLSEESTFQEYTPVDFEDTLTTRDKNYMKGAGGTGMDKEPVSIDFSKGNIQKAFIMKEILSPPAAIKGYDKDLFSSIM